MNSEGDVKTFATVYPLCYAQDRTETLVAVASTDSQLLMEILLDPLSRFMELGNEWVPAASAPAGYCPIPWRLKSPVNVLLRNGYANMAVADTMRSTFTELNFGDMFELSERNISVAWERIRGYFATDDVGAEFFNLVQIFCSGGFYAEFAVDTHSLLIEYFPPFSTMADLVSAAFPGHPEIDGWETGESVLETDYEYTDATVALTKENPNHPGAGTFHFDLKPNCTTNANELRAKYLYDLMTKPLAVVKSLNHAFGTPTALTSRVHLLEGKLTPSSSGLTSPHECDKSRWKNVALPAPKQTAETPAQKFIAVAAAMPPIIAEGLSVGGPIDPCIQHSIAETDSAFVLQTVIIKEYVPRP